jgi:galactonate dehydratase
MKRRDFMRTAGVAAAAAPFWMGLIPEELSAKIPDGVKITDLKTIIVEDEVYLKIFTNVGVIGEGQASVHRKSPTCEAAVNDLARVIVGKDPTRIEWLWQAMYRWPRWRGGPVLQAAISGVDLALWDILGKLTDLPVYQLLGGAARDRIRLYVSGSGIEGVQRNKSMGYTAIKTGLPITDDVDGRRTIKRPWKLKHAVKYIEDMRIEAGDDFDILIDAHGLLTPVMALEYAKAIEPYRVMFLEEPIQIEGYDHYEWLVQHTTTPIATGERHVTKWQFEELISRNLISYVQPDIIQCGGITELKKIAAMAEAKFIEVAPHGPGSLSSGLGRASLHLDACIPNFAIQESHLNPTDWKLDLHKGFLTKITDGYAELPNEPGLGLQVDWDVAKKHPHTGRNLEIFYEDGSITDP